MLGRPPNLPRRRRKPARHRPRRHPGQRPARLHDARRRVPVPADRRRRRGARADAADAAAGGDRGAVDATAARDRDERRVHVRRACRRWGCADDVLASFPEAFRDGHGRARGAARRPRAERAGGVGGGLGTGDAHVLVTRLRRRRRAPARGAGSSPRPPTPSSARRRSCTCSARRRWPAAATTSASSTGSRSPRSRAPASTPRPGDGQPDGAGGWRDVATGEVLLGYVDEDGTLPAAPLRAVRAQRDVRRLPQAGDGRRPRSGATSPRRRLPGRRRRCWRRRSSAAGRTARRSRSPPTRPDAAVSSDSRRINDFGYDDDPGGLKCPLGAHIRRANPRDDVGFFDGRLSNRHRIVRRGRAYGTPLPPGVDRGRRRRPRPGLRLLPGRHLAPVRDRSRRSGSTTATRSASAATRTSWSASRTAPRAR